MTDTMISGTAPSAVVPGDATDTTTTGAFTGKEPESNPGSEPGTTVAEGTVETKKEAEAEKGTAEAKPEEAAKSAGAPEQYEAFKAPEGVALDEKVMGEFANAARELNLPQDAAQKMVDKMAPLMAQRQAEQLSAMRTEWETKSKTDAEFGGDKLEASMVQANKAMNAFATDEFRTLLNETGLGNHPEWVRFMVRAGKAISEDKIVKGGAEPSSPKSLAERMYGNPEK